jgi:hypothetical protein
LFPTRIIGNYKKKSKLGYVISNVHRSDRSLFSKCVCGVFVFVQNLSVLLWSILRQILHQFSCNCL